MEQRKSPAEINFSKIFICELQMFFVNAQIKGIVD